MRSKIKIDTNSKTPVYKQIIIGIEGLRENGEFEKGNYLPSMNELATELNISRETVKKAYSLLRKKGVIESAQGKGFFIAENINNKTKILVLFDKISSYKQVLYSSLLKNLENSTEITIRLHNQDIDLFEEFVEENLDDFDYYIITPHFNQDKEVQKRVLKTLKKIPNRKLLLLDRHISELSGNFGSIYQDFEEDVYYGLKQGIDTLRRFNKLNIMWMKGSMYAPVIIKGISKFCIDHKIDFEVHTNFNSDKIIKHEAYLILNSQLDKELIELATVAKNEKLEIGKDIGIISYNESPINEIILNGLTTVSTDFNQMGELAAKMIRNKTMEKVKCDFKMIRRSTF